MSANLRTLLVEDNPGDADLILEMLSEKRGMGFKFECLQRLSAALERLEGGGIDLVLLDLGLPDSDGLDSFHRVRDAAPHIPIVVMTGNADEKTATAAVREGAQDYLIKGQVSGDLLVRSALYAVERKRAEEEREKIVLWQQGVTQLQQTLLAPAALEKKLKDVTAGIVRLFNADFCRIWLIRSGDLCAKGCFHAQEGQDPPGCGYRDRCLHLLASSGRYTHTDGPGHCRIPFGSNNLIGRIASGSERKFITNDVPNEPLVHDHEWARKLGLVSFAGYQLRDPAGEIRGICGLFAKRPILPAEDTLLEGLSSSVALVIQQALMENARDRAEAELRQAQKMEAVGRLAGGVAHDFNNMLGVILGHCEMALVSLDSPEKLGKDLLEIKKAAQRSADLTRQLLAFSRKQVVSPRVLDLNQVIAGQQKMLERLIGEDVTFRFVPGGDLWNIRIDPSQIDQILANLAVNARDAIAGVGVVTTETANITLDAMHSKDLGHVTPGDYVMIAFSDTGVGIDSDTLKRIFEPFFTTKEEGKGTGLGLSTVYGIVKQNYGLIYVYSEPGTGTSFKIFFPRHRGEAEETVEKSEERYLAGTETVLIAEDDEQFLDLAVLALAQYGYNVLAARTPAEACRLAEKHSGDIHLLLTDVVMPLMNGKELQVCLEKIVPGIKTLFMSGYPPDIITERGVLDQGGEFIQKPFSNTSLAVKVRAVLDAWPLRSHGNYSGWMTGIVVIASAAWQSELHCLFSSWR